MFHHTTLWASIKNKGLQGMLDAFGMTNALRIALRIVSAGQRTRGWYVLTARRPICSAAKERRTGGAGRVGVLNNPAGK